MYSMHKTVADKLADESCVLLLYSEINRRSGTSSRAVKPKDYASIQRCAEMLTLPVADNNERVTVLRALQRRDLADILDQPDAANDRSGRNAHPVGLVVERDVPAHDGELQNAASLGHTLDRLDDHAHGVGLFRIAEIE